jgi:hypothetical protein
MISWLSLIICGKMEMSLWLAYGAVQWVLSLGSVDSPLFFLSFPFFFFPRCVISLGLCSRGPVAVLRPSHLFIYHWFHSLMYGAEDPSIAGMVLDSPFSDLVDLMMELVGTYKFPLPKFTVSHHSVTLRELYSSLIHSLSVFCVMIYNNRK